MRVDKKKGTFKVSFDATDNCRSLASVVAVMEIPAGLSAFRIEFQHDDGGEGQDADSSITFDTEEKRIVLQGKDETAMRSLLAKILADGGVAVSRGQQLGLRATSNEEKEIVLSFRAGVLIDERSTLLRLTVTARDAAGNSATATAVPQFAK